MAHTAHSLLPPGVHPDVAQRQITRYRTMSFEEKLRLADDLGRVAWGLTCAGVRLRHPDFDDVRVREAAREIFRAATD